MDVRQLRYFGVIAELGSVSAAANRLGVAQPSLSLHVKNLEEELGITLLVRSPRGVILTDAGQILLAHAKSILDAVDVAVADLRNQSSELKGAVTFAIPSSASNVLSVPLCETVQHECPNIMLRTMEAMSGHVQEWLVQGQVDIGILYDIRRVKHLRAVPLLEEDLYLVVSPENWSAPVGPNGIAESAIALNDCANLGLVLPHRTHGLRELVEDYAAQRGINLHVPIEMDSLTNMKALVSRGSANTILARAAIVEELRQKTLIAVPISDPLLRRTVYLVRNPSRPATQAVFKVERLIIEIVIELVNKGRWPGELLSTGLEYKKAL
jgi:LysR family nitrogen assimilation transcriptional regulator